METEHKERKLLPRLLGTLHWVHWAVIILSLSLTFGAWYFTKQQVDEKVSNQFHREAEHVTALIQERMRKYEEALWAGVAAIHSQSHGIDGEEWQRFSSTLRIDERYPGINGIGVIHQVLPKELKSYLAQERKSRPNYKIHPPHEQNEYWPITYIEPVASNAKAVGLDMAHETNRFTAAKKARDTGKAQITGPIVLVQDSQKTPGFLFYAPYYKDGIYETLEERQKHFKGLVYAPFIMKKLLEGTLAKAKRQVGISIHDGTDTLYDEHLLAEDDFDPNPLFERSFSVDLYGRPWVFDIRSTKSFRKATAHNQPLFILLAGLVIDALLIGLFLMLTRSNAQAKELAQAKMQALEKSEITHQAYLDASGDGYWDWRLQEDYAYMSPQFWKMFGYDPEEKKHHSSEWQDIIFEDDLKIILANLDQHIATKGKHPFSQEVRYKHKDGSTVTVICRGEIIEWGQDGTPLRIIGTHTDITALKDTQRKLLESHSFQQLIMENNPDLIFVKDREFRIIEANTAFLALYPEDKRDQIIGHTTIESYAADEREEFLKNDKQAFKDGYCATTETIRFPNGETRILYTQKIRFENTLGEEFILGLARDVTEREKLITDLQHSNRELDDFAYIASHDLKEPLRGIHNHSRFLLSDFQDVLDEEGKHKLDRVMLLAQRMEKLINDLLYYSRLGRTELALQETNLVEVVEDVKILLDDNRAATISIEGTLPITYCDKAKVTELFRNLITNALKYNESDTKKVVIGYADTTKNGQKKEAFYIRDNGIGIIEKHYDNIFKIFKRLHHKNAYGGGTGSGLTFVKKIVEQHDGAIWLDSKKDEGTTFYFTLNKGKE